MLRSFSTLLSLVVFWLLLSGIFTPFLIAAGVGCALAVTLIARRMGIIGYKDYSMRLIWRGLFLYCPWLLKEIMKSAWDVTKRILDPRLPISPTLVEFRPSQQTELGLVIHANSITLTPGTISVEVEANRFLVHALTQSGAVRLAGGEMDRRCAALERV